VIRQNNRAEQRKIIRYNHLVANLVVFHNVVSMTRVLQEVIDEGYPVTPEILARLSPYKTEHVNRFGGPRSARKESFYEETLLEVDSVARGTCHRTRGRRWWEAPSTMRRRGCLQPRALLARVWLRLRKKLPSEAPHDGPPGDGRPRVELLERWSRIDQRNPRTGRLSVLRLHPESPGNARGNEPS
jgi:Tn3 transposase DDE domain-containing protein